jgi:hypothetical protein
LNLLKEGEIGWFDLAAVEAETSLTQHRSRLQAVEA